MIELNRPILLPPPALAGATAQVRASAASGGHGMDAVAPVPAIPAGRHGHEGREAESWPGQGRPADDTATPPSRRSVVIDGIRSAPAAPGRDRAGRGHPAPAYGPTGSAAFLAQQIFQETMSGGLHLEPWMQGIGAYRRAGAEPPLESGRPALLSLAV